MTRLSPAERLAIEKLDFLAKVQAGIPILHAALDVGWSPSKLSRLMRDRDFSEQIDTMETYRDESVELVLHQKAVQGHTESIKMWLERRQPDRWGPPAQRVAVQHSGGLAVAVIDATREAVRALIAEDRGSVHALGPGGVLDIEDADAGD